VILIVAEKSHRIDEGLLFEVTFVLNQILLRGVFLSLVLNDLDLLWLCFRLRGDAFLPKRPYRRHKQRTAPHSIDSSTPRIINQG